METFPPTFQFPGLSTLSTRPSGSTLYWTVYLTMRPLAVLQISILPHSTKMAVELRTETLTSSGAVEAAEKMMVKEGGENNYYE